MARLRQLIHLYVVELAIELPICPLQQVDELVTRLAPLVYKFPRLLRNYLFDLGREVFEKGPGLGLLLLCWARLHILLLTGVSYFFLRGYFTTLGFFLFYKNLLLDYLVVAHFLLHKVVLDPLYFLQQPRFLFNRLLNQNVVL